LFGASEELDGSGAGAVVVAGLGVVSGVVSVVGSGMASGVSTGAAASVGVAVTAVAGVAVATGAAVTAGLAVLVGEAAVGVAWARTLGVGAYFSTVFSSPCASFGAATSPFSRE